MIERIQKTFAAHIAVIQKLDGLVPLLAEVAQKLTEALANGNKALFFGNGGSAADAQHLAAEFVGRFLLERRPLPAIALTVDTSALTAIGNDYGYDVVFSRQLEALANPGDLAFGISTSGNSKNVLEAFRVARKKGVITVGLTGQSGGAMAKEADYCFRVPTNETPRIQEAHILIGHTLCDLTETALVGG